MLFSVLIISLIILFYFLKRCIKIISLKVASLFNTNIELNILKFMWALIWNFKDIFLKIYILFLITYFPCFY